MVVSDHNRSPREPVLLEGLAPRPIRLMTDGSKGYRELRQPPPHNCCIITLYIIR